MDIMIETAPRPEDARRGADRAGLDEVAVGTGASIVVVVAATLAVTLAVLVASLGHVVAAPRETAVATVATTPAAAVRPSTPIALALLGVSATPARDGLYHLPAPKPEKSLAVALLGGLFLAMTGAAGVAWRAAIGSVAGGRGRRAPEPRRLPPVRVTHPYRASGRPGAGRGEPRPT